LHNYYERVCLIQLSIGNHHAIVDPIVLKEISPLLAYLRDRPTIYHGADYDLRLMQSTFDFAPAAPVFDTMLAAQLLGFPSIGLAALVKHFFGIELPKEGQKSNWARRPLSDSQLRYAIDDTRYLDALADLLEEQLREKGRLSWHAETCARMVEQSQRPVTRDADEAWRIKGLSGLSAHELAYVREIWNWRESQAQRADLPPFKVLGNKQLIELATWAAKHPDTSLDRGPKLPRNCVNARRKALERAIAKASKLPQSQWPAYRKRGPKRPSGPDCKKQIDALRARCAKIAASLDLDPAVVAPKATLTAIARSDARTPEEMRECSPIMRWQIGLVGDAICDELTKENGAR
jgi:ribonuclease D